MHDPICSEHGDLSAALYGSFLPVPDAGVFPAHDDSEYAPEKVPGAVIVHDERIVLNSGRSRVRLRVTNTGDRPIQVCISSSFARTTTDGAQVGSHYHFIETNAALSFDRARAYGSRLDIPAGTAVRFEPGDMKTVALVEIAGARVISGGNGLATGPVDPERTEAIVNALVAKGFAHVPEPSAEVDVPPADIGRTAYVAMYGPTTGDRVRLGDTALWVEVERDEVRVTLSMIWCY